MVPPSRVGYHQHKGLQRVCQPCYSRLGMLNLDHLSSKLLSSSSGDGALPSYDDQFASFPSSAPCILPPCIILLVASFVGHHIVGHFTNPHHNHLPSNTPLANSSLAPSLTSVALVSKQWAAALKSVAADVLLWKVLCALNRLCY
jgi:hypothetical protein